MKRLAGLLFALFAVATYGQQAPVRVAVGRTTSYTDSKGQVWQPDTGLFTGAANLSSCAPTTTATGTPDPGLYKNGRYGTAAANELTYTFKNLANGTYTVNIYTDECYYNSTGRRIFSTKANGAAVFSNVDLFATVGKNVAYVRSLQVVVSNGTLAVVFVHGSADNPTVNAIELLPQPPADTTSPTISIVTPKIGQVIQAATPVQVLATDNVGVAKVSATLDGQDLGTPTVSASVYTFTSDLVKAPLGAHVVVATASDAAGNTSQTAVSFSTSITVGLGGGPVTPSIAITTNSLPPAQVGTPYSAQLSAGGGKPPYVWTVVSGSLPSGLTLSTTGLISGTPISTVISPVTIQVTDSSGAMAQVVIGQMFGGNNAQSN